MTQRIAYRVHWRWFRKPLIVLRMAEPRPVHATLPPEIAALPEAERGRHLHVLSRDYDLRDATIEDAIRLGYIDAPPDDL